MGRRLFVGSFATEEDILGATRAAREKGLRILDVYTPYAVHGLDGAMGLRKSLLPWACFGSGLFGLVFALWFQFWTMAQDWPVDVGGKPWNSLPAYVPVTFELMVLLAGLGVVLAFIVRCGLFPGKQATLPAPGLTDNRFVLVLDAAAASFDASVVGQLCHEFHAIGAEEREE